jgi:tetratricopeptide (TPR) repeat protein
VLIAGNYDSMLARVETHAADLALALGQPEAALAAAERAVEGFQKHSFPFRAAEATILRGEALRLLGRPTEAMVAFESALGPLNRAGLPWMRYRAYLGQGYLRLAVGDRAGATDAFRAAIADVEAVHANLGLEEFKVGYFGDKLAVYEAMVTLALHPHQGHVAPEQWAEALNYIERAKSRALLDRLAGRAGSTSRPQQPPPEPSGDLQPATVSDTAARVAELRDELNWLYNRLNSHEIEGTEQLAEQGEVVRVTLQQRERELQWLNRRLSLARHTRAWDSMSEQVTPFAASQLQEALPPGTTLLEFYSLGDELIAFVVDRQQISMHRRLASIVSVRGRVQRLHFQLDKFRLGPAYTTRHMPMLLRGTETALRDLYQELLAPLMPCLSETTRLVIVPHGQLHTLPFHALMDEDGPLLARWEISYTPSASILLHCLARRPAAGHGALVMGLPDEHIPQVRAEVEAVAACLADAHIYLDQAATATRLYADGGKRRVLHLATHGLFRADNPLFSALKLADGWLSLADIYDLTLPAAELVTLSACQTGAGHVASGDEIIGLSRAFFATGTPSLVVSLWTVDDQATTSLMTRFYTALHDGLPKAAALRHAQLATRNDHPHPYFWAPFILLGQPR